MVIKQFISIVSSVFKIRLSGNIPTIEGMVSGTRLLSYKPNTKGWVYDVE